jgi:hypothetical protein
LHRRGPDIDRGEPGEPTDWGGQEALDYLERTRNRPVDIDQPTSDIRANDATKRLLADDSPPPPARPSDMPRSWGSDKSELWRSLSDDARAAVQERESERDAEVHRRQNEAAEVRRQAAEQLRAVEQSHAAEAAQIHQVRQQYELAIHASLAALEPEWSQFAGIKTREDLERLNVQNPQAAHRFVELGNRVYALQQQGMQVVQQRMAAQQQLNQRAYAERAQQHQAALAQQQQAHQQWVREQDDAITKAVPELADPEKSVAIQRAVEKHARESLGFSQEEISHHYTQGQLRDARVQKMLYQSTMYEQMLARARAAMPEVRSPLRPGTSNGQIAPTNLNSVAESGNMAEYIKMRAKGRSR